MTGDMAAAGEIVAGGMLARSVEPHAGEGHGAAGDLCLNCGTRLVGAHCHRCGQAGHVHRTVGAIGHEVAHGVFHFEGKIWRTLPLLALRPGELTRRYVHGERARFVSPMAIFLFSVFLLFAVVAQLPGWHIDDDALQNGAFRGGVTDIRAKLAAERLHVREDIAEHAGRLDKLRSRPADADTPEQIAAAERKLKDAQQTLAQLTRAQRFLPAPDPRGDEGPHSNSSWVEAKWRHAKENPQLLFYKIKSSAYKFSWALIPISLPFIWLLFPFRRGAGMYDHAVFATYSLSFMSLLVVVLALLSAAGASTGLVSTAAILIPPFHIYRQLKGAYRLSRAGALWRTFWMLVFTVFTSSFFILLLIYIGTAD